MARACDSFYSENSLLDVIKLGAIGAERRHARGIRHPLSSMLAILLIGFLLGQQTIRGICRFFSNKEKLAQLKTFLDLPYNIPSPSCFSRTLSVTDPLPIVCCYADFLYQLVPHNPDMPQHICADGKALNAAENRALTGKSLYIINIFLAAYHLFSYHVAVGPKSQEGKVLEEQIYDILFQDPSVVTADAMGTKKKILELICKAGSNAVLPVKANNSNLMKCLLEFIVPLAQKGHAVDSFVDLNGFSESDAPSDFVENTRCAVFDEDNRKESASADEHPIEGHVFFDKLYDYSTFSEKKQLVIDPENRKLSYVLIGDKWVRMAYVHGRFERREYELVTDPELISALHENAALTGWENVAAIGLVTRYRGVFKRDSDTKETYVHISVTRTPYILTENPGSAAGFAEIVRNHWAIEEAHNTLDTIFGEDRSTVRTGRAPEICSFLRKMAFNMLSLQEAKGKKSSSSTHVKRIKETMEKMIQGGILGVRKLLIHRFKSPYLS